MSEKLRIRFRKDGPLRFVGHRDLFRGWDRLLRRSGLPIRFTEGFNPKPRMSSPTALALGVVGLEEILEISLTEPVTAETVQRKLQAEAPEGLCIVSVRFLPAKERTEVVALEYFCSLPAGVDLAEVEARIVATLAAESLPVHRRHPKKPVRRIDIRPLILDISCRDGVLRFRLKVDAGRTVRPEEMLGALGLAPLLEQGMVLTRSVVELASAACENDSAPPLIERYT